MSEHFDVCVLGGQPAGFLAAALCAKRGLRTLLIDHGEGFDHYKQGGVTYPLLVQPLVGLRGFKQADLVLSELGAQVDLPRRYIQANPPLQVIFPRHRLDLGPGSAEIAKEAKREFGDAAAALGQALDALTADAASLNEVLQSEPILPVSGMIQRFSQNQRLKPRAALSEPSSKGPIFTHVGRDQALGELLMGASLFTTYLADDDPPESVLAFLTERVLSGSVRLESGGGTYLDVLTKLVTNAGGVVKRAAMIDSLASDGGKLLGAETSGNRFSFNADYFISALYSQSLWQSLPRSRTLTKFVEENSSLRVRAKLYFHHFLVHEDGLPVGLGDNVLLLNGRKTQRDGVEIADTAVWITVRRGHTKEHALLSAAIEVRESDASSLPEQLSAQRKRVRKQLERLLPFIAPFIVSESSPMAPSEWDAQEGSGRRLDPWLLHPLYEPMPDALLGITGLPFHTPFKNLFRVGRETLPGLGPLGDFVGARMVAHAVQMAAGKK